MSYIEREALRDALYEADAITMKGVAIINQFPAADVAPVVHCENCQHIHVLNTSEIYAICDKTNFVFQSFGVDTREFGCPYGERRESEAGK